MQDNKDILKTSSFFSGSNFVKKTPKDKTEETDPFVKMVETGTYKEIVSYIAINPNVTQKAIEKIIEKYPLQSEEHWELRDLVASNKNLPLTDKIKTEMETAYESEEKNFWEVRAAALSRYSDVTLDSKDKIGDNITATTHRVEAELILGDSKSSEETKKAVRQRLKQHDDQKRIEAREKAEDIKIKQEIVRDYRTERQKNLNQAKTEGIFDESMLKMAKLSMLSGSSIEKAASKDIFDRDRYEEKRDQQKLLALKETRDIKMAKQGQFSQESVDEARKLIGKTFVTGVDIGYGMTGNAWQAGDLSVSNKDLTKDQIRAKEYAQQLVKLKRQDELKRARKGDFSDINVDGTGDTVVKGDVDHLKEIQRLKKIDELKRAKKGDFSGIQIPENISNYSKQEQQHFKELSRLKKVDELKRARQGDFSGTTILGDTSKLSKQEQTHQKELARLKKIQEEKEQREKKKKEREEEKKRKDRERNPEKPKVKDQAKKGLPSIRDMLSGEAKSSAEELASLKINSAQVNKMAMSLFEGLRSDSKKSIRDLEKLRTGSSDLSGQGLDHMQQIRTQIQRGTAKVSDSGDQPIAIAESFQNAKITRQQPNTNKLHISEDRISQISKEIKETLEYKTTFA